MSSRRNSLTSTPLTLLYDPRACSYFLRMYGFWDENLIVSQSQAWESIWRDWLEESSIESRVTNLSSILIFLMVHFLQHKTSNHAIHNLLPSRALCSSLCKIRHVHMFTALLVDVNWELSSHRDASVRRQRHLVSGDASRGNSPWQIGSRGVQNHSFKTCNNPSFSWSRAWRTPHKY